VNVPQASGSTPLGVAAELWDVLACPCPQHAPVRPDVASSTAVCTRCQTSFDVRDGVPVMLLDEARPGPKGVGIDVSTEG
jgi:uncharacterized protein YbaR (Trm112 family)